MVNAVCRTDFNAGTAFTAFILVNRLCLAVVHHIYIHRTYIDALLAASAFFFVYHDSCH